MDKTPDFQTFSTDDIGTYEGRARVDSPIGPDAFAPDQPVYRYTAATPYAASHISIGGSISGEVSVEKLYSAILNTLISTYTNT